MRLSDEEVENLCDNFNRAESALRSLEPHWDHVPIRQFLKIVPPPLDPQGHKLTKRFVSIMGAVTNKSKDDRGDGLINGIPIEWKLTRDALPSGKQVRLWQRCPLLLFCIRDERVSVFLLRPDEVENEVITRQSATHSANRGELTVAEINAGKIPMSLSIKEDELSFWMERYHVNVGEIMSKAPALVTPEDRIAIYQAFADRLGDTTPPALPGRNVFEE
jgi:hypothetical protein